MMLKLVITLGILFCYFENYSTSVLQRKKRETENIFYGNQQGSPHLSVKKNGPTNKESNMMTDTVTNDLSNLKKKRSDEIDFGKLKKKKRQLLKRAKRTLVANSMENQMGPSNIVLKRKKRSLDELDSDTLDKLRALLADRYDSYYEIDGPTPFVAVEPPSLPQLPPSYSGIEEIPISEEDFDVPSQQDYLRMMMMQDAQPEVRDEYPTLTKRYVPKEEFEANNENGGEETIPYELAEINGIPGLFFPLPSSSLIDERELEPKKRKRDSSYYNEEDNGEAKYNSKLAKLAAMLADNRK